MSSAGNLFCVIYRTGGTINFQWHRSLAMARPEASQAAQEARRMGYAAHVERCALSMSVGLPESFAPGGGPLDPQDYIEYEDREAVRSMGRMEDLP